MIPKIKCQSEMGIHHYGCHGPQDDQVVPIHLHWILSFDQDVMRMVLFALVILYHIIQGSWQCYWQCQLLAIVLFNQGPHLCMHVG